MHHDEMHGDAYQRDETSSMALAPVGARFRFRFHDPSPLLYVQRT